MINKILTYLVAFFALLAGFFKIKSSMQDKKIKDLKTELELQEEFGKIEVFNETQKAKKEIIKETERQTDEADKKRKVDNRSNDDTYIVVDV